MLSLKSASGNFLSCLFLSTTFLLLFNSCGSDDQEPSFAYSVPESTSDGWETASLADVGIDEGKIVELIDYLLGVDDHLVRSIAIAKDGKLVFEHYFTVYDAEGNDQNYNKDVSHFQASVTKSWTSALYGIALEQGIVPAPDTKIFDYYTEYDDIRTSQNEGITVNHLLTMTGGLNWTDNPPYDSPEKDGYHLLNDADPIKYVLSREMLFNPGQRFHYNSGFTDVLGDLIKRGSGMALEDYAQAQLFEPLDIDHYFWQTFSNGLTLASGGLFVNSRSMLKLGQLYLQNGEWDGAQILPSEWVNQSIAKAVNLPNGAMGNVGDGYGFQWWLAKYDNRTLDAFVAAGWGGQYIIAFPELSLVVAITAGDYERQNPFIIHEWPVENYILSAIDY